MATSSGIDVFDNLKGYAQGLLVGSFAFGSVFPLALKTVTALVPGAGHHVWWQVVIFTGVNVVYFVVPLVAACWSWWHLKVESADDALFKTDFLKVPGPRPSHWMFPVHQAPFFALLLIGLGTLMYPCRPA